jgi:hypothetical protein
MIASLFVAVFNLTKGERYFDWKVSLVIGPRGWFAQE